MEFNPEEFETGGGQEAEVPETEAETVDEEIVEYVCPKCDKTYKREASLVKHVKRCKGKKHETLDNRDWTPEPCPKCGKTYKRKAAFDKHVESCEGPKAKVERVPMTDEEKATKRKEYVQRWVDKNVTIQIRVLKESDDMEFIDSQVAKLKEDDESAGWATYFRNLFAADKKKAIRKGDWYKVEEEA